MDSEILLSKNYDSDSFQHIEVDPGRNNTVTVFEKSAKVKLEKCNEESFTSETKLIKANHNPKEWRNYSSGECHQSRKTRVYKKKLEYHKDLFIKENIEHEKAFELISETSFKCTDHKEFMANWITRLKIEDILWKFYGKKMFRKWKFTKYQTKHKTHRQICLRILGFTGKKKISIKT